MVAVHEMNCEACLVHRVAAYPMVAAVTDTAFSSYQKTKEWSPLVGRTLGVAEATAKVALSSAYPLYRRTGLEAGVEKVAEAAVARLDSVEAAVPALKMTPGELVAAGKERYFEGGLVQRSLALLLAGKDAGLAKAEAAAEAAKLAGSAGKERAAGVLRYALLSVHHGLDATDRLVDAVLPTTSDHSEHDYAKDGILLRALRIGGKTKDGLWTLAARNQLVTSLGDYGRALATRASGAVPDMASLRDAAVRAAKELESRAAALKLQPEALLLSLVRGTSGLAASFAHKTAAVVPKAAEGADAVANYIQCLDSNLQEAASIGEVGSEMLKEAKAGKEVVEEKLVHALELISDTAPLSWMGGKSCAVAESPESKTPPENFATPDSSDSSH